MSIAPMRVRAIQVALVLELVWAVFLAYEVHHPGYTSSPLVRISQPWDFEVLDFVRGWAEPAIAIIAVVWLVDLAAGQWRRGGEDPAADA